jgi:hypothetical protein
MGWVDGHLLPAKVMNVHQLESFDQKKIH